ncbi:ADP-ribosylglycohydrolase family protein [Eremomyces bilateralis CBS 781.70]|uniref:ADP-ribosylhydrolase ARH3 n=1 Tax=Eremomyces bilateralis CBS 781.70 TaxID=1392243 RepID=A0A6G1GB62_9PEZI|nr:ADP-ribosylglycohydrolase family protein [Eremomyces bilateralis CBS 781.70]KAF1815176.1 ADP-ribosylglycohydrolase family protein [Eremomyces bilateralis CBS 781.70]
MESQIHTRAKGALYGVLVGDALGGPVQFMRRGTFKPIQELQFVKPFQKPKGSWSDDGSLTLCLAKSLSECNMTFSAADCVAKMVAWHSDGYMSSSSRAWDEGQSTRTSLAIWRSVLRGLSQDNIEPGPSDMKSGQELVDQVLKYEQFSGNGSLMRVVPVGLALWQDKDLALTVAGAQSNLTHPSPICAECCAIYTSLVVAAMKGATKDGLLQDLMEQDIKNKHLRERLGQYKSIQDWKTKSADTIKSTGYVLDTLEVALWAMFKHDSWVSGALEVVNLGGDSDTAGAIYGGLAGAYYGVEEVPWRTELQKQYLVDSVIEEFSNKLLEEPRN